MAAAAGVGPGAWGCGVSSPPPASEARKRVLCDGGPAFLHVMTMDCTVMGSSGRSACVGTCQCASAGSASSDFAVRARTFGGARRRADARAFEILTIKSYPWTTFPKTGCWERPGLNQSRKAFWPTLMKNCEPPESFRPVLAIERVPGAFEIRAVCSSGMVPSALRRMLSPVARLTKVEPGGGPPVPARGLSGSLVKGQPNWS